MSLGGTRVAVLVRRFPKLSETFILGEISSLADAGVDIEIVSLRRPSDTVQQPEAQRFADRVSYLDEPLTWGCALQLLRFAWRCVPQLPTLVRKLAGSKVSLSQLVRLHDFCGERDIGHIHAHYISEPALLAELVSSLRKRTFSVSAHAKDIYLTGSNALRERLRHAAFVTTCTAHNQEYLLQHAGANTSRVHLVYHGIDSERFRPGERAAADERPLLIGVGRYKRKKGFDLLVAACARLAADGCPVRCDIVGYGDQEQHLRRMIADHGLQRQIRLVAPVSHRDLVGMLQAATACVLPCRQTEDGDRDGIPNAMLEAMSCELPVISTTVSGIPEVVESGCNGLLVEPDDVTALAIAIRTVLENAPLRRRLATSARITVTDRFCWRANIETLRDLLQNVLAGAPAGRLA